jgi:long-chain acyl-CoA synthetase
VTAANLVEQLRSRARDRPDDCALATGDNRLSLAELLTTAETVATRLDDDGVRSGALVALRMSNTPEWAVAYFGVLLVGGDCGAAQPSSHLADNGGQARSLWSGGIVRWVRRVERAGRP